MTRPQSIIWFERFFLGSMAIGLFNSAMNWTKMQEQIAANPDSAILPSWFMPAMMVFGIGINLLLWYFAARKGSVVAKWIIAVLFGFGVIGIVLTMIRGQATQGGLTILGIVTWVLSAIAVVMLFRSDAKAWFAGDRTEDLTQTFS